MRARRQEEVEKQLEMAGRAAGVSRLELMRQRLDRESATARQGMKVGQRSLSTSAHDSSLVQDSR